MKARDRHALAVGALLVAGVFAALRVVPWASHQLAATAHRLREHEAMLTEARSLLASTPALRDSLASTLRDFVGLAPKIVEGRTHAEASASLAAVVHLVADQCGLKVIRLEPVSDSAPGVFRPVTARGEFEGDANGLAKLLRAIERSQPLLSVGQLAVLSPDPTSRPGLAEALRIEADITAWYLARGSP